MPAFGRIGTSIGLVLLAYVASARGQEEPGGDTWFGRLADGTRISHEQLTKIINRATDLLDKAAADAVTGATQLAGMIDDDLRAADLRKANLNGADLADTTLTSTDLYDAYLQTAQGLTLQQLSEVKTLHNANLLTEPRKQVERIFPHLLQKPIE